MDRMEYNPPIGEKTISSAVLGDSWIVPLETADAVRTDQEAAQITMLQAGDSNRQNVIAQLREADKLQSDLDFRLSPTNSLNP